MNSDEIVESLQPYGIVKIFQNDDKEFSARCYLFMHGMKSEVHSDFGHPTMLSALKEVQKRVMAVVVSPGNLPETARLGGSR